MRQCRCGTWHQSEGPLCSHCAFWWTPEGVTPIFDYAGGNRTLGAPAELALLSPSVQRQHNDLLRVRLGLDNRGRM